MLTRYQRVRLFLALGVVLSLCVFVAVCSVLGVPSMAGYGVSLLRQPWAIVAVIGVVLALGVSVLLSSLIAGGGRFDAGLFCGAVGLMAVSLRDGSMRTILQGASGPGVYWVLAIETALLLAAIYGASLIQEKLAQAGWIRRDVEHDELNDDDGDTNQLLTATAVHAAAMAVVLMLLAQSEAKKQAIVSVAVSAFLASLLAYQAFPLQRSRAFWLGPAVVGVVGYVVAFFMSDGWAVGDARGLFAGLARPLPLDYAGPGTAGAILGYWVARSWRASEQNEVSE